MGIDGERWYFRCNVCGTDAAADASRLSREDPSCPACGSSVRMRALVHVLSCELFGRSLALPDFPEARHLTGVGMSDWETYATRLREKLGYTNRYYTREPRMDITDPPARLEGRLDFLISTDVFEHVAPPVVEAFRNARRLLKPRGVMVFSVPYAAEYETVEHFPDLFDYELREGPEGPILSNRTREGLRETFRDLVFHGGDGATLELRVFSEASLRADLAEAGFEAPTVYGDPVPEFGIRWEEARSLPMAVRPRAV